MNKKSKVENKEKEVKIENIAKKSNNNKLSDVKESISKLSNYMFNNVLFYTI
jgi:hypothetical protein